MVEHLNIFRHKTAAGPGCQSAAGETVLVAGRQQSRSPLRLPCQPLQLAPGEPTFRGMKFLRLFSFRPNSRVVERLTPYLCGTQPIVLQAARPIFVATAGQFAAEAAISIA